MTAKHFILATAGHVDHGKSTLVKALTGTDPDRLPEEKLRGITIDLGFAELNLSRPNEERFQIGIIDVPGHEDFVRNMIAGVGSIDLALLVVAADDGWMPQTEEHLQILIHLGVSRAVVALTKTDIGHADKVEDEIRDRLRDTHFANAPTIRTSFDDSNVTALSSHVAESTISELKNALAAEFARLEPARDIGKPRLFVDRAFTLHGVGTVVTGTLIGGKLSRGQTVCVQTENIFGRIRSIQSHSRDLESVGPATRTAINLAEVEVGDEVTKVHRGDVVTIVDLGESSTTIGVLIERSQRVDRKSAAARPIKNGSLVYLHHGTSRVSCKIVLLEGDAINSGERVLAQLRLASPIFAFLGDRFVLRDPSEQFTIGGGTVLDPSSGQQDLRSETRRAFLAARAKSIDDVAACIASELAHRGFAQIETVLRKSNFSSDEITFALRRLADADEIVTRNGIATGNSTWRELIQQATTLIDNAHREHSERRGLDLSKLRGSLKNWGDSMFDALVADLCKNGFVRERSTIARKSHRAELPPQIETAAEQIRTALGAKPLDPPGRKNFAKVQTALRFLIEQGEVVEVNSDIVLLKEASDQMRSAIVEFISQHGPATASELRQHLASSRRVIIPFLEYLDRNGVTRRAGDKRVLVK
jgi:selenocysteine-specific elongation factor